jgi:hypothetical protein
MNPFRVWIRPVGDLMIAIGSALILLIWYRLVVQKGGA